MASFPNNFNFIIKEKLYFFFLLFICAVFIMSFFLGSYHMRETSEPSLDEKLKKIEKIADSRETPAYLQKRLSENPVLGVISETFMAAALFSVFAGVFINVILIRKTMRGENWIPPGDFRPEVRWGIGDVFRVIILFVFYGLCLNFIFLLFRNAIPQELRINFLLILHTVIMDAWVVGLIFYFLRKVQKDAPLALGFHRAVDWTREIWIGVKAYFAALPSFMVIVLLLMLISNLFHYEPSAHPLVGIFIEEGERAPWLITLSLFLACILGPIVEEIFFRGFLYPAIRKHVGIGWASVSTAALFALIHENAFAFLPVFFLGLVLSYLYEKRGNLVACASLHIIHNSVFIFYFFLMKAVLLGDKALS